jgi:peptide/nickel transport system substrate-binding protein
VAQHENYVCGSDRNYSGYCNPELDKEFDRQSMESDQEKRKKLVWEIHRKLQEDGARRSSLTTSPRPAGSHRSKT